jgi:cell division protein FtsI (penicillin-binding protein 3)
VIFTFFAIAFAVMIFKAVWLQISPDERVLSRAERQYTGRMKLPSKRGDIFDRNGNALAVSLEYNSLFVDHKLIEDKERVARELNEAIGLPYKEVLNKISQARNRHVWLKRFLTRKEVSALSEIVKRERGLKFSKEPKRAYPNNTLASHIIGFAGHDAKGMEGIESYYDAFIKGEKINLEYQKDRKSRLIYSESGSFLSGNVGNNIYLTIDSNIQYQVEKELKETMEKTKALGGTVIVMDPYNGEIVALANYPDYDLNNPIDYSWDKIRNRAVTDVFEPGSSFKIITAAIALKNKVVDLDTEIYGEGGKFQIAGGRRPVFIREAQGKDFGTMKMEKIISHSSNIGSAKLALMMGQEVFYEGLEEFGFGKTTDVDLPGEVSGRLRQKIGKVGLANIGMGQGLSVTSMQMVKAYSIIANGGYSITPHIVKSIVFENTGKVQEVESQKGEKILPTELTKTLAHLLRSVVEQGTGTSTDILGFDIAGKTGTAQKPVKGGYSHDKYVASFAGFFPAYDPVYTMLVMIDEPQGQYYASLVAVPLFRKIAQILIQGQKVKAKPVPNTKEKDSSRLARVARGEKQGGNGGKKELKQEPTIIDPSTVPDLKGKSLRQALKLIGEGWTDVKTYGHGKVVRQDPAAGPRDKKDKVISIWLE